MPEEKQDQPQCHIHDDVSGPTQIRSNVCVKNEPPTEFKGNHYCIFHLPTNEKDIIKFEQKLTERLDEIEKQIASTEKLSEEEQKAAVEKISYDFRYVWFPSYVVMSKYDFRAKANFQFTTFSRGGSFSSSTFRFDVHFNSTVFVKGTHFDSTVFLAKAYFNSATFATDTNLSYIVFSADVFFELARFSADIFFLGSTFVSSADFGWAKFEENSQIFFNRTSFQGNVDFGYSMVNGFLYFEAGTADLFRGEWLDIEETKPKKKKGWTSLFENKLNFAHVNVDKPERIFFDKVRLRPSWFINVDSRKFVFTDIVWENHTAIEVETELNYLARKKSEPHNYQLLTTSLRNLAANAEEFNRLEEASIFRKSAFECERLERIFRQKQWWDEFKLEREKPLFENWKRIKEARFDLVNFMYRWLSYYGESWSRAFLWLWVIWIVFAFGYFLLGEFGTEQAKEYLGFGKSFAYSLFVMTLQKPDPRPLSALTYILYGLETIFAPVQAALLALAIRRKFMR